MSVVPGKRKFDALAEESKASVGAVEETVSKQKAKKIPKNRLKVSKPTSKIIMVKVGNKAVQYHQCNVCKYKTNRVDNMRKHLLVHSEERPEKCKICGMSFKDRSNCLAHTKLVHSNERPFSCEVCGKKFKTAKHLRQHSHIHNPNGKPHKCPKCPYASVNKCVLREHIDTVHLGKTKYTCVVCGKGIKSKSSLDYHLGIHKKESELVKSQKVEIMEFRKEIKRLNRRVTSLTNKLSSANFAKLSEELKGDLVLLTNFAQSAPEHKNRGFVPVTRTEQQQ